MYVAIDTLNERFLTVLTPVVFDLEMKLYVILYVAAFVLLTIAYLTDEDLFVATGAVLNDILYLVQGVYVDFFLVHAFKEL